MTNNTSKIFFTFLFVHLAIWTLVPALTNQNLPLDTIEALAWGSNLDWGFNKHPPLSAFVVEIVYKIFGSHDWAYYLLSQLFVIFTFFIIWRFSDFFLKNQKLRLISVLLLEGIYFYNFTTPEFNVYICQLPFRALAVYYCWKSLKEDNLKNWLFFGLFIALGFLSHYLFIYLIIGIKIFFLYILKKEKKLKLNYLIPGTVFLIAISPHLVWLVENNYITVTYAFHRTGLQDFNILNHVFYPLTLLGKQLGILLPFFIMLAIIISKFKIKLNFKDEKLLFLLIVNAVPIIFVVLTSIILGVKIRTMWMSPFYLFFGVLLIYIFQSQINLNKLKSFVSVFLILFIFSPFAYAYISITQTDKRTDYPGKLIAKEIQKKWDNKYKSKISFVVGDEWIAGNLSYHLKSRPIWITSIIPFFEFVEGEGTKYIKVFGKRKRIFDLGKSKLKDNVITLREDNFTLIGFK